MSSNELDKGHKINSIKILWKQSDKCLIEQNFDQVLLLADNIIVKQLLLDKETNTVGSVCIKHMNNFSEFVKVVNTPNTSV